ncbi:hypothetical protein V496_10665 [Pseudogymnoascus sp. VKM F-4515 (FW-2607)]|nr:hypothetical protein V496_10665 [Pseudogymnoascus sp. VKM F-4515 (FW-2607)]
MQDTNYVVKTFNPSTKTKMPRGGFMSIYRHPRGSLLASFYKLDAIGISESDRQRWPYENVPAMDFIHSRGVIQRDMGPHNLLVHVHGRVILYDLAWKAYYQPLALVSDIQILGVATTYIL